MKRVILSALAVVLVLVSCSTTSSGFAGFDTWNINTELQAAYLEDGDPGNIKAYAKGRLEQGKPVSPTFTWSRTGVFGDPDASVTLLVWEDPADVAVYQVPAGESSLAFPDGSMNFRVNTTYHWQVRAVLPDGTEAESEVFSFRTEGVMRNLGVDGVINFRDLGGRTTMDGATVRQGLLYRSGRFNEKFSKDLLITERGLAQMRNLGIATDVDLRGDIDKGRNVYANGYPADGSETMVSPLGADVNYVLIPRIWNNLLMTGEDGASMMREIFDVLCEPDNYPVVIHCSVGTDRTGVAFYLICCALGLSDQNLLRDYLFSNFSSIGGGRQLEDFDLAITGIRAYEGETYQEKGLNYLLSNGVTERQIEKLKSILLEY